MLEHLSKREELRHAIHQREHVVVEDVLQVSVLIERVEHFLRVDARLEQDDDANILSGLVADIFNPLNLFLVHEVGHFDNQLGLIDLIGQ